MQKLETTLFHSSFTPSSEALALLKAGRIIAYNESPQQMMERVISELTSVEDRLGHTFSDSFVFGNDLLADLDSKRVIMSTPILTNAGRYSDKPLSACTIPPINIRGDVDKIRPLVDAFHEDGMGTGFNFNETDDPVRALHYFNRLAIEGEDSGKQDRPVGNIGVLSVHHPQIIDFITAKSRSNTDSRWIFNISIDASDTFMHAVINDEEYTLTNGKRLSARLVFDLISESAHQSGDPGFVFLHRMNQDNPTPGVGKYTGTAPCAEVGLAPGESCVFGYINVGVFFENGRVNFPLLSEVTKRMVRALDDALELSIDRYAHPENSRVMRAKRKIGVGVCGLSDLLIKMKTAYDSEQAYETAQDVVAFINLQSKVASHELAAVRGSFGAMGISVGNRYYDDPSFLEERYGDLDTDHVSSDQWLLLGRQIRESKLLRHATTIALPPTGRSGLIVDASTGVEPPFSLQKNGVLHKLLAQTLLRNGLLGESIYQQIIKTGSIQGISGIPNNVQRIFKTATEIEPRNHILMASSLQRVVDEAISKTVNMPEESTSFDVGEVYMDGYNKGLKGITIYRANSRVNQPKDLI